MEDIEQEERRDGIKFSWNVWPTKLNQCKKDLHVPIGCIYSPMNFFSSNDEESLGNSLNEKVPRRYESTPILCNGACKTIANPFASFEVNSKFWTCPFCLRRNPLPNGFTKDHPENFIESSTMEYVISKDNPTPDFIFVVDTCLPEKEFVAMKESLIQTIGLIPPNCSVALITFNQNVSVYDLEVSNITKAFVFNGKKNYTVEQLRNLLGIKSGDFPNNFIKTVEKCDLNFIKILENLQPDPWYVSNSYRPLRSTGLAFSIAAAIINNEELRGGRVLAFLGGPCTYGQGIIVGTPLKENIRSHNDIAKGNIPYFKSSSKFYSELASKEFVPKGFSVDFFMCSLDQIGIAEMKDLASKTGGTISSSTSFLDETFRDSVMKFFEKNENNQLKMGFNATIELHTFGLQVVGALGHVSSLNKTNDPCISEEQTGVGGTCSWKICGLDERYSLGFVFHSLNNEPETMGLIQFQTIYNDSDGNKIMRVTTITRKFMNWRYDEFVTKYFDQETAAVLTAKQAVFKADQGDSFILRWIDSKLIKLMATYCVYRKDDPSSLTIGPYMKLFPQFMFYFRRSQFVSVFGSSPDETTYARHCLYRENVDNCLIMIQPFLESYSLETEPELASLSATSILPDRILLLDAFFYVVVLRGTQIMNWISDGHLETNENLKTVVTAAEDIAMNIVRERYPSPRFVVCNQGSGDARLVMTVVDPSVTHKMNQNEGEVIFSEDANLKIFSDHLRKLTVTSPQ